MHLGIPGVRKVGNDMTKVRCLKGRVHDRLVMGQNSELMTMIPQWQLYQPRAKCFRYVFPPSACDNPPRPSRHGYIFCRRESRGLQGLGDLP